MPTGRNHWRLNGLHSTCLTVSGLWIVIQWNVTSQSPCVPVSLSGCVKCGRQLTFIKLRIPPAPSFPISLTDWHKIRINIVGCWYCLPGLACSPGNQTNFLSLQEFPFQQSPVRAFQYFICYLMWSRAVSDMWKGFLAILIVQENNCLCFTCRAALSLFKMINIITLPYTSGGTWTNCYLTSYLA